MELQQRELLDQVFSYSVPGLLFHPLAFLFNIQSDKVEVPITHISISHENLQNHTALTIPLDNLRGL